MDKTKALELFEIVRSVVLILIFLWLIAFLYGVAHKPNGGLGAVGVIVVTLSIGLYVPVIAWMHIKIARGLNRGQELTERTRLLFAIFTEACAAALTFGTAPARSGAWVLFSLVEIGLVLSYSRAAPDPIEPA